MQPRERIYYLLEQSIQSRGHNEQSRELTMNKSMKVWSKRRLKIRDSRRDIDAEVLEAMAQVHRGEGTIVFQGDDCPYPVGTRLPLSAHALMDIPITEDELKAHIMNDEVTRMYPHVIQPIALNKETTRMELLPTAQGSGHVSTNKVVMASLSGEYYDPAKHSALRSTAVNPGSYADAGKVPLFPPDNEIPVDMVETPESIEQFRAVQESHLRNGAYGAFGTVKPHVPELVTELNISRAGGRECVVEQRTSSILVFEAEVGESEVSFVNRQAHLLGITVEEVQALSSKELSERLFDTLSNGHGAGWAEYRNNTPFTTRPITRADIAELINRRTVGNVEHASDDNYNVSGFPHNPTVITPKE